MRIFIMPLLGVIFLLWGARASEARRPGSAALAPPLEWRVAAGLLGTAWGWLMANLAYAPDAVHKVVGFPLPVYLWVNRQGTWFEQAAPWNLPFLVVDILLCVLGFALVMRSCWERWSPGFSRIRRKR